MHNDVPFLHIFRVCYFKKLFPIPYSDLLLSFIQYTFFIIIKEYEKNIIVYELFSGNHIFLMVALPE